MKEIADTLLKQLGGAAQLKLVLGATITEIPDGVRIRWPNRQRTRGNDCEIVYKRGPDAYTMTFYNTQGTNRKQVQQFADVYADGLIDVFEQQTGWVMALRRPVWRFGSALEAVQRVRGLSGLPVLTEDDSVLGRLMGYDYSAFIRSLKSSATDKKVIALVNAGLEDGVPKDDVVQMTDKTIKVTQLHPCQNEIDIDKSLRYPLTDVPTAKKCISGRVQIGDPLVTFRGRYIIDGHHRWSQVFALNSEAKMDAVDLTMGTVDPMEVLKAVQLAIVASTGDLPTKSVEGTNLFMASEEQIRKYVVKYVTPEIMKLYAEAGFGKTPDELAEHIYNNVKVMQQTSQPAPGAPERGVMPQTDQAPGWEKALKTGETDWKAPHAIESAPVRGLHSLVSDIRHALEEAARTEVETATRAKDIHAAIRGLHVGDHVTVVLRDARSSSYDVVVKAKGDNAWVWKVETAQGRRYRLEAPFHRTASFLLDTDAVPADFFGGDQMIASLTVSSEKGAVQAEGAPGMLDTDHPWKGEYMTLKEITAALEYVWKTMKWPGEPPKKLSSTGTTFVKLLSAKKFEPTQIAVFQRDMVSLKFSLGTPDAGDTLTWKPSAIVTKKEDNTFVFKPSPKAAFWEPIRL